MKKARVSSTFRLPEETRAKIREMSEVLECSDADVIVELVAKNWVIMRGMQRKENFGEWLKDRYAHTEYRHEERMRHRNSLLQSLGRPKCSCSDPDDCYCGDSIT